MTDFIKHIYFYNWYFRVNSEKNVTSLRNINEMIRNGFLFSAQTNLLSPVLFSDPWTCMAHMAHVKSGEGNQTQLKVLGKIELI